ncbi:tetrathionate reductase family octaheme c-type cytochrome [Blastochloris sulfoviridis]|uniref:Tetrathionate reductase family octaheme c-type cytochrome n=1 Tax=Blastochloris sulfoviridis TaxID=50712 RepID=A0A5M6HVL1_9HYPH|nr:tetrathionate reductase family octaheme c-type cytochrome [Blastochloris sulfoviridis]NJL07051.1 tetrathionate reductase family octaheme c-type cytochrome [Candidatus Methylacidiphilales bacterium]
MASTHPIVPLLFIATLGWNATAIAATAEHSAPAAKLQPVADQNSGSLSGGTADHTKFEALKGPFQTGADVTKACLTCHNKAGEQVMKSVHWTWDYRNPRTGQLLGKKNVINNFCTNARGNEGMCAQCHAGYGWTDATFDFTDQARIDCLVCHDRTATYYRLPNSRGSAICGVLFENLAPIDFAHVAQNVGLPGRENCGTCHFNGGGGDGVKHGDLDSSLTRPSKALDVHMAVAGPNFACTQCHVSRHHQIAGSRYDMVAHDETGLGKPGARRDVATCESCHGTTPHPKLSLIGWQLNHHAERVACQTCHIPRIARGGVATVTDWDWSTAGRLIDGKGYAEEKYVQADGTPRHTYWSIKGNFKWDENFVPTYQWFDGRMVYTTADTKIDAKQSPVPINVVKGDPGDPNSRIWPFKQVRTKVPWDPVNKTLVFNHLWGDDDTAFWGNFDLVKSVSAGMKLENRPFSGTLGFLDTVSNWPITHMVAPKGDAVGCGECHKPKGRLAAITGVYLPGRDGFGWLDTLGIIALSLTLAGIAAHAAIRLALRFKIIWRPEWRPK